MYFAASLFAALIITLFIVSRIAKMLHAKRPEMAWIFLASIVGGLLASLALVPLNIFVLDMEPMVMLIISVAVVLVVSSAAFKYINQMNWGAAITTNVSNVVIGLMTVVVAVFLNGESIQDTIGTVMSTAKTNSALMESVATGELDVRNALEAREVVDDAVEDEVADADIEEEGLEPVITELDFLLPSAAKEIKAKQKKKYVDPKFHVVSIGSIHSAVGRKIRIVKKNGTTILGSLKRIDGNNAVISQRLNSSGEALTPISIATIRKLEVYR